MKYRPALNQERPLLQALGNALDGATKLEIAVAYVKASGAGQLLSMAVPRGSRAVVGLGFGLTDPPAVERLDEAGLHVRCVFDGAATLATQFHPKLYLASHPRHLVVLAGSANLTQGGLTSNVEQYEELTFVDPSKEAADQRDRFELLWGYGRSLGDLKRSGDWNEYRARARERRRLELEDRGRVIRLHGNTGRLIGQLARRDTRRKPGYLAITHPDWWAQQLAQREEADVAVFWRRNINQFRALAPGGCFFHLIRSHDREEELRAVEGFSIYAGGYETVSPEVAWRRYGLLLGAERLSQLHDRLDIERGRLIGLIHLTGMVEFPRRVTLDELRANGIAFARNIVSGRGLTLDELATVFELGGLGVAQRGVIAAEEPGPYEG